MSYAKEAAAWVDQLHVRAAASHDPVDYMRHQLELAERAYCDAGGALRLSRVIALEESLFGSCTKAGCGCRGLDGAEHEELVAA